MQQEQEERTSTAVARVEAHPAALIMDDEQIRLTYRIAESLYRSGAWGLKNAEAAFAKIVVGRDLGLSAAQAMQGIHIVEGGIQMHYAQIGQFVRAREGYDYRAGWLKQEAVLDVGTVRQATEAEEAQGAKTIVEPSPSPPIIAVYHDEEEATDFRPIIGAFVEFYVDGERRGVSRFTIEDAVAARLIKPDKPQQAWKAAQRNMLLARAMSNGAKWFVPEVFGGMPVYSMGEIPAGEQKSLTAPAGDGGDEGSGIELGPRVEAIIARATEVGHRGLSNRAAVELACGNRAQSVVNDWVVRAGQELDRFVKAKAEAAAETDEPPADGRAAVVRDGAIEDAPEERPVEEEVDAEPVPDAAAAADTAEKALDEMADEVVADAKVATEDPEVVLLRDRLRRLEEIDPTEIDEEQAESLNAEIEMVENRLRARGVDPHDRPGDEA